MVVYDQDPITVRLIDEARIWHFDARFAAPR
jgi:hypothetical protein